MINPYSVTQYADNSYAVSKSSNQGAIVRAERNLLAQPKGDQIAPVTTTNRVSDGIQLPTTKMDRGAIPGSSIGSFLPLNLARLVSLIGSQQAQSLDAKQTEDFSQNQQRLNCQPCDAAPDARNNSVVSALEGRLSKLYQIRRLTLAPMYSSSYDLQVAETINQKIQALESELLNPVEGLKEPTRCHIVSDNNQYHRCTSSK